jgi:hypothetical protein
MATVKKAAPKKAAKKAAPKKSASKSANKSASKSARKSAPKSSKPAEAKKKKVPTSRERKEQTWDELNVPKEFRGKANLHEQNPDLAAARSTEQARQTQKSVQKPTEA